MALQDRDAAFVPQPCHHDDQNFQSVNKRYIPSLRLSLILSPKFLN
jgi:hypothetical protein